MCRTFSLTLSVTRSKPVSVLPSAIQDSDVPPESIRRGMYSIKSDVFHVGKMLMELSRVFDVPQLEQLGSSCCRKDPSQRSVGAPAVHRRGPWPDDQQKRPPESSNFTLSGKHKKFVFGNEQHAQERVAEGPRASPR